MGNGLRGEEDEEDKHLHTKTINYNQGEKACNWLCSGVHSSALEPYSDAVLFSLAPFTVTAEMGTTATGHNSRVTPWAPLLKQIFLLTTLFGCFLRNNSFNKTCRNEIPACGRWNLSPIHTRDQWKDVFPNSQYSPISLLHSLPQPFPSPHSQTSVT